MEPVNRNILIWEQIRNLWFARTIIKQDDFGCPAFLYALIFLRRIHYDFLVKYVKIKHDKLDEEAQS